MGTYRFEDLSQDDLRKLVLSLEKSDVPIFLVEPENKRVIFANTAWTDHASRLHDNIRSGMDIQQALKIEADIIAPHLPAEARAQIAASFTKTILEGGQYEFGAPNGKLFRGQYINNGEQGTLGISFDVTEIKTRRNEAQKAQKTLQTTMEGLHHGVMLYDETGHVSYFNESFRATAASLGIKIEKGLFHKSLREQLPEEIKSRLTTPGRADLEDFEFIQLAPTGKHYLFEGRRLPNNTMLVSTVDVTELELKKAEASKTRKTLEKSLEGLPHGVLLYNQLGKVEYFNSEFEATIQPMGMHVKTGMRFTELSAQVPKSFRAELKGHGPGQPFEFIQKRADGKSFLLEGHPIDGVGFLITTVDVTALNEAMEAARAADIAKTSFLANMSHEIRTPMNGVLGMAQVLEQSAIDDHQQKCIDIIKTSSEMLLRIINDILDFSKLEAEKIEIEEDNVDIEDIVNRAIDIVRPALLNNPKVEIINDMAEKPAHAHLGDADRIRQVLINLLSNGLKFTHEGHVRISTSFSARPDGRDQVTFVVEDTGIGISEDKYDKIFERFEQSDNSTTRKYGGTGLGLAISRRLARLMDGDLKICKDFQSGACFEFSLTLKTVAAQKEITRPAIRAFNKLPILIIDDNKVNHMVLTNQLKPLRVKPYCVTSATQGLTILKRTAEKGMKIPLVICDYQMPVHTGYDFVRQLKADPSISDTSVMILSSADIMSHKKDFKTLGVKKVLEKPCSTAEIVATVSDLLFQSQNKDPHSELSRQSQDQFRPSANGTRILVADDDPVNREVFKGLLALRGYQAHIVNNGLQALQAYCENPFDLVLMDISMPVLGGLEATKKIRRFEKLNNLPRRPVIAVTAHALKGDKEKFIANGMDAYLPKPVLRKDFDQIVETWLSPAALNSAKSAVAS